MIKRYLKNNIINLYDFEYTNKKYSVYLIDDELHIAHNIYNKKAFCSVFHCNLTDRRGIADTLELFSYMGSSKMIHKTLRIDKVEYDIKAIDKVNKILSFSSQYEFMIDPIDDKIVNIEEITGNTYRIDTSLYGVLNAVIILSIILWINISSNLIDIYSKISSISRDNGDIITLQPDSCMYRYCVIPLSEEYFTLNVIGNSPYHTSLVTDYDSDGVYEMRDVKVCTIISQSLVKSELIFDLFDKIKSIL